MTERLKTDQRELDELFERYRAAPKGHVFAPLADACRKAGMLEEALDICAKGLAQQPRYASGYVVQGKCLYDAGRARDAQAAFDRVLELDPKNLVALKFLGIIAAERGDTARAREYFEHILALDPSDREIRSRMEDVSHEAEASPLLRAVVPTERPALEHAATHTTHDEEIDAYEDAVMLPDVEDESFQGAPITLRDETVVSDEIATMTLANIYANQGYTARALKIYREVSRRQPDNRDLAAKIESLERIEKELAAAQAVEAEPAPLAPVSEMTTKSEADWTPDPVVEPQATALAAPALPSAPATHPMDTARSYEQFKRWLKATSR